MRVFNLLMVMFLTGSFHLKILELGQPEIKYLFVISLLKRLVTVELRSCSLGKVWKLSPPNRIDILPEWEVGLALQLKMPKYCLTRLQLHKVAV